MKQEADVRIVPAGLLDRNSPEPLYLQIRNWMLREIDAGRWPVHYKLPAEDDLARALNVNRGTLRKAIRTLIAGGRLAQIHGKGTFVASIELEQPLADRLVTFSEDLINRKISFETRVLDQAMVRPTQRVASLLGVEEDEVFYLKRVRHVEGAPLILLNNYVVRSLCPGIEQVDFTRYRLFEVFEERFGLRLDWGRRTFAARPADPEVAALLAIPVGEPVMYIEQVVYLESGLPIELSDVWLHGDRFSLSAEVKRRPPGKSDGGATASGPQITALDVGSAKDANGR